MINKLFCFLMLPLMVVGGFSSCKRVTTVPMAKKMHHINAFSSNPTCQVLFIQHHDYKLYYNTETNLANWVSWSLKAEHTNGTLERKNYQFTPDPDLPVDMQVDTRDYSGSGYTRGHLAPAADMKYDDVPMRECFYMSNICPQTSALNSSGTSWTRLEDKCRAWARQEGEIFIVCGPIFKKGKAKRYIGKTHKVAVPDAFFKVVLSTRRGHEKALGFMLDNNNERQAYRDGVCSVDDVERVTGYDFFDWLPDDMEDRLEASSDAGLWGMKPEKENGKHRKGDFHSHHGHPDPHADYMEPGCQNPRW